MTHGWRRQKWHHRYLLLQDKQKGVFWCESHSSSGNRLHARQRSHQLPVRFPQSAHGRKRTCTGATPRISTLNSESIVCTATVNTDKYNVHGMVKTKKGGNKVLGTCKATDDNDKCQPSWDIQVAKKCETVCENMCGLAKNIKIHEEKINSTKSKDYHDKEYNTTQQKKNAK